MFESRGPRLTPFSISFSFEISLLLLPSEPNRGGRRNLLTGLCHKPLAVPAIIVHNGAAPSLIDGLRRRPRMGRDCPDELEIHKTIHRRQ